MNTQVNDKGKPSQDKGGEGRSHSQPDAGMERKQAGQTDPQQKQADRRSAEAKEKNAAPQARTADSSPGDPQGERTGTTPPDGPLDRHQRSRDSDPGVESVVAAEPGRGQLPGADPRVDIGTADSTPAPDAGTTGSDRDTLKPGV